jgi:putative Mg2+ transporter-C (MgtC) family protein
VALGSCLFALISAFGIGALLSEGGAVRTDPTRIAAQIVSGIGFLGGGAILHYGGTVRGLTTAASLWAVAAVGMAAGAGLFVVAVVSAVLVIVALEVFQRLERVAKRMLRIPTGPRPEPIDDRSEEGD